MKKYIVVQDKYFPDSESPYGVIIPGGVLDRNRMDIILKDVCCAKAKPEYREKYGEKIHT
jgi:hypothetical protein